MFRKDADDLQTLIIFFLVHIHICGKIFTKIQSAVSREVDNRQTNSLYSLHQNKISLILTAERSV